MPCSKLLILKNCIADGERTTRRSTILQFKCSLCIFAGDPDAITAGGARARGTPVLPSSFRYACRSFAARVLAVQPEQDPPIAKPSVQADRTAGFFEPAPGIWSGQRKALWQNPRH